MGKKSREKKLRTNRKVNFDSVFKMQPRHYDGIKIMVAMPIHYYMEPYTWICYEETRSQLAQVGIEFVISSPIGIPDVGKARNKCVEAFLADESYTHIMWIDSDMIWDPTAVLMLLEHKAPATSALVTKKGPPFSVTLFELSIDETGEPNTYEPPFGSYPLDKPFTLRNSGIGTAFMLIERHVMEKIPIPHFAGFIDKKSHQLKGTDFHFCIKLLQEGFEFIYDPRPRVYHIGRGIYGVEDTIAYLDKNVEEGITSCPFSSSSAESVAEYKRSFAGPQPSLIASTAPVVAKQIELSQLPVESKSETSSCQSSSEETPKNQEKKTGTDQPV